MAITHISAGAHLIGSQRTYICRTSTRGCVAFFMQRASVCGCGVSLLNEQQHSLLVGCLLFVGMPPAVRCTVAAVVIHSRQLLREFILLTSIKLPTEDCSGVPVLSSSLFMPQAVNSVPEKLGVN
jgi:hypothetical protein